MATLNESEANDDSGTSRTPQLSGGAFDTGPTDPVSPTPPLSARLDETRPAEAATRQYLGLVPPPKTLGTLGLGLLAAGLGALGAVWLTRDRRLRRPTRAEKIHAQVNAAADLAPIAARLLANPVIREYAIRLLIRQLTRRLSG